MTLSSQRSRLGRKRKSTACSVVSAMMLLTAQPTSAFHPTVTRTTATKSSLDFQNDHHQVLAEPLPFEQPYTASEQTASDASAALPVWLSIPRSHLAESNLQALLQAMRASFFTENESLKLAAAIEQACPDSQVVAGCAEFCLILVECMEMGLNALRAAVYHYAQCVAARRTGAWPALTSSQVSALESFGTHAVALVQDVARLKQLEVVAGSVHTLDHADNLRKLLLSETKDWRALAIRSAACLYRLRGLLLADDHDDAPKQHAAAREALTIYAPLASRLGMHRLKNELEGAAFRILYPLQYQKVTELTHQMTAGHDISDSMKLVLETVQQEMTQMLENDAEFSRAVERFSVTARVKEPYSLWRKMLRHGYTHVLQVPDALALRIVLDAKKLTPHEDDQVTRARERALCYYAQSMCAQRWKPVRHDPRFKDYIASPKPNGYQSLHYTASCRWHGQEWTVEIQVRSGEMHQVAEFGPASHWDYKWAQKNDGKQVTIEQDGHEIDTSSDAYLRNVQQWHWQQHVNAKQWDAVPASSEPVVLSDIWQSRERSDRIRERTQRLQPYINALTGEQSDLARDFVFVFWNDQQQQQQVLALKAGSCVVDALREIKQPLDRPLAVNGNQVQITRQLHNGDVLTVPAPALAV